MAVYLVNIFFGVDKVSGLLSDTIKDLLPPGEMSENLLSSLLKEVNSVLEKSSVLGWIGIFSLIWLSSALFSSFRSGLNRIFDFKEEKFFLIYKFRDMLVTIVLMLFVLISTYALPIIEIIENMLKQAAPDKFVPFLSGAYFLGISLFTSFLMFYFLFRYVPTQKTPKVTLYMSTLLCVVLNEISRRGFAWYISGVTSYGSFYGTYAILASMALWVYYLVLIMLLSAEFSKFFNDYLESRKSSAVKAKANI